MSVPPRPKPKLLSQEPERARKVIPIIRASGYHIPTDVLDADQIQDGIDRFTFRFYNESSCKRCEYLEDRHSDLCEDCNAYTGSTQLAKVQETKKGDFLYLPIGNGKEVKRWLDFHNLGAKKIDNVTDNVPIETFKFTRKPWPYQNAAALDLIAGERGSVTSAPRTGKTVIAAIVVRRLLQKTLILAHQREWLDNFMATFLGSAEEAAFTDLDPSRIGFAKKLADFERLDIALATFQQFFNKSGAKVFSQVRSMFPLVIVDECHYAPAPMSAKLLSQVRARYRIGLSGSPDRKDGRYVLFRNQVGPVLHETSAEALRPTVIPIHTGMHFAIKHQHGAAFTNFKKSMENAKQRQRLIIEQAIKYAKRGHFVILPVTFTKTVLSFVELINNQVGEPWARPFHGGLRKDRRAATLVDAKNYEFRILVANIALISTGVNIPRASCLIDGITPTSNLPKARQRFSRILTPVLGKPTPTIVFLMDNGLPQKMRINEFWNALKPLQPIISSDHYQMIKDYLSNRPSASRMDSRVRDMV